MTSSFRMYTRQKLDENFVLWDREMFTEDKLVV